MSRPRGCFEIERAGSPGLPAARPSCGDQLACRDLVLARAIVARGDPADQGAGVDLECVGNAHERLDGRARGATLDLADRRPVHLREVPEIFERNLPLISCKTNSAADLFGGWRMKLGHATSVLAAGEMRQRESALSVWPLGAKASIVSMGFGRGEGKTRAEALFSHRA